jgi:SrtB family sortase
LFFPDAEEADEKEAILTAVTEADGSFSFEGIPFGHYVIREITAPSAYTVSLEQHHVYIGTDRQTIGIRIYDSLIRGSVQVMKTELIGDKEDPLMRRLPGAVFELYADSDGDGKLGESDPLLGALDEKQPGLHERAGLLSGRYFIKEKSAPDGYIADEDAYSFEITEDGDTAVIENGREGFGFVNKAFTGALRIVKNSSDGRRDGFAFEVKSEDGTYREIFTTDKTGTLEAEGLRTGSYTVTEVENRASRGYIVPDGVTVLIESGRTAEVRFFNEAKETPEPSGSTGDGGKPVPQTSDGGHVVPWAALLAFISVLGILGSILFTRWRKQGNGRLSARRGLRAITAFICLAAGVSAFMLISALSEYDKGSDAYAELATAAGDPTGMKNAGTSGADTGKIDFDTLSALAPDAKAWLSSDGNAIDYPLMQAGDNSYYLKHLYDGTKSKVGSLFIDYENDPGFTDRNTVIYGHNMADGSMLASLNKYRSKEYFGKHKTMRLITPDQTYTVEIFSAFKALPHEVGTDTSPWTLDWPDAESHANWLSSMKERSTLESGVTPSDTDRIVTLSTCTDGGRARFIVMGRLVSAG